MSAASWWGELDRAGFEGARLGLSLLWQSSILLAATAGLTLALRHRRAAVRHALWIAALLLAPATPVLTQLASGLGTPRAELPVLPAYVPPAARAARMLPPRALPEPPAASATKSATVGSSDRALPTLSDKPTVAHGGLSDYPWALALLAYAAGATAFLALVAIGRLRLGHWVRTGRPATDPRLLAAFATAPPSPKSRESDHGSHGCHGWEKARDRVGNPKTLLSVLSVESVVKSFFPWFRLSVVESARVHAPLTLGVLRPVVLLPAGLAEGLSESELRAVALHELAHVRRHDPLLLTLVSLVRAALFFHPLVWLAARQVASLAEQAADDAVLDATGEPLPYAKMLARIAERLPRRALATELAAGFVLSKSAFLRRVEAILSDRRAQLRRLTRWALAATALAALASLALALLLPLGAAAPGGATAELLAKRPPPDLARLAARSNPTYDGPDATESFYDILKLREVGKADAVPVLEQIVVAHLRSTRIHGFAAAQALYCIATPQAQQVLSKHLLTGEYRAGMAIDYAFHWEMPEPQRSRFIEQYLLKNLSEDLVVELQQVVAPGEDKARLDLLLTLRNASERPLRVIDREVYLGNMLFLRAVGGPFARSGITIKYDYNRGPVKWIELGPGQTRQYPIGVRVKPAAEMRARDKAVSRDSTVVLETEDVRWDIGKPGRYEVVGMFEAAPLTAEQEKAVKLDHVWSGRAVSKPILVDVPDPTQVGAKPAGEPPWSQAVNGLRWRVTVADEVECGEPAVFHIELQNAGAEPLCVLKKAVLGECIDVSWRTATGRRDSYPIAWTTEIHPKPEDTVLLQPGDIHKTTWAGDGSTTSSLPPGVTTVELLYFGRKNTNPQVKGFWSGDLRAKVRFTAMPPREETVEKRLQASQRDLEALWALLAAHRQQHGQFPPDLRRFLEEKKRLDLFVFRVTHTTYGYEATARGDKPLVYTADPFVRGEEAVLLELLADGRVRTRTARKLPSRETIGQWIDAVATTWRTDPQWFGGKGDRHAIDVDFREQVVAEVRRLAAVPYSIPIDQVYPRLDCRKRNTDWFSGIEGLRSMNASWCLATGLAHPHVDVRIKSAQALGQRGDPAVIGPLLEAARRNAELVGGSENATLHGIYQHALADALNHLTGSQVKLREGQDPEGLRKGIEAWEKWLSDNTAPPPGRGEAAPAKGSAAAPGGAAGAAAPEPKGQAPDASAAKAEELAWGETNEDLRSRWIPIATPVLGDSVPSVSVEVENAGAAPIVWQCKSGISWGIAVAGITPRHTRYTPQFTIRALEGSRLARAGELPDSIHADPAADGTFPGCYYLPSRGRLVLTANLPERLVKPGRYDVEAVVLRRVPDARDWLNNDICCPPLALTVVAPPAAQPKEPPTPPAGDTPAARAKSLRGNVSQFMLAFGYTPTPDRFWHVLMLTVPDPPSEKYARHTFVQIGKQEAEKLIDHLEAIGFFGRAKNVMGKGFGYTPPACVVKVWGSVESLPDGRRYPQLLTENLGWDLKMLAKLDAIRKVLDGDAAKAMDQLLAQLEPQRKEWQEASWGEPVEGVQAWLRPVDREWKQDAVVRLVAAVRNQGQRDLRVVQAQELCELEIDGQRYRWAGNIHVKSSWFPPGRRYDNVRISLVKDWKCGDEPLVLKPGKHSVRVWFVAEPTEKDGGKPVRFATNSVDIVPDDHLAIAALRELGWQPMEMGNLIWDSTGRVSSIDLFGPSRDVAVTDAWLVPLKGMTELRKLYSADTRITDAGLANLRGLTNLRELRLQNTRIGDAGLAHLAGLTNLEWLELTGTQVTDAGLVHLGRMTSLKSLFLSGTKVADEAVAELKRALPNVKVYRVPPEPQRKTERQAGGLPPDAPDANPPVLFKADIFRRDQVTGRFVGLGNASYERTGLRRIECQAIEMTPEGVADEKARMVALGKVRITAAGAGGKLAEPLPPDAWAGNCSWAELQANRIVMKKAPGMPRPSLRRGDNYAEADTITFFPDRGEYELAGHPDVRKEIPKEAVPPPTPALEFRVVPNPDGTARAPLIPNALIEAHSQALTQKGPAEGARERDAFRWFELGAKALDGEKELEKAGLIARWQGRRHILLCDWPPLVLPLAPEGAARDWRLAEVAVRKEGDGRFGVVLDFDEAGGRFFADLTGANLDNRLAILVAGKVVSAPVVRMKIFGKVFIDGGFTQQEAEALAATLRGAAAPGALKDAREKLRARFDEAFAQEGSEADAVLALAREARKLGDDSWLLDALKERLGREHVPRLRRACLLAISWAFPDEAAAVLARALNADPDRIVRKVAAYCLANRGTEQQVDALVQAIKEDRGGLGEGRDVARVAIGSLGLIGGPRAAQALRGGIGVRSFFFPFCQHPTLIGTKRKKERPDPSAQRMTS
ncbi:MAG: hypothetical protein FJ290_15925, partial [Planctomycetes bacterium]|nr:hypothetical protein [Planctomycetota bacterium]